MVVGSRGDRDVRPEFEESSHGVGAGEGLRVVWVEGVTDDESLVGLFRDVAERLGAVIGGRDFEWDCPSIASGGGKQAGPLGMMRGDGLGDLGQPSDG